MIAVPSVREVLKEGKIVKISARTGDHQDRYLFLVRGFGILNFQTSSSVCGGKHFLKGWGAGKATHVKTFIRLKYRFVEDTRNPPRV
jgi:hypothetical protein